MVAADWLVMAGAVPRRVSLAHVARITRPSKLASLILAHYRPALGGGGDRERKRDRLLLSRG